MKQGRDATCEPSPDHTSYLHLFHIYKYIFLLLKLCWHPVIPQFWTLLEGPFRPSRRLQPSLVPRLRRPLGGFFSSPLDKCNIFVTHPLESTQILKHSPPPPRLLHRLIAAVLGPILGNIAWEDRAMGNSITTVYFINTQLYKLWHNDKIVYFQQICFFYLEI